MKTTWCGEEKLGKDCQQTPDGPHQQPKSKPPRDAPHLPGEHHATMSAASPPIPQAGDEPVWVKDDDEDLEELVDLTGDAEIASSHQIDLQARLRPRAQFGGLG